MHPGSNRVALACAGPGRFQGPCQLRAGRADQGKATGRWEVVSRFTIEVEGGEKPAAVADSVGRALIGD